jgi:DNA-binding GntR family transcriptional regulator
LGDGRDLCGGISALAHMYGILLGRAKERICLDAAPAAVAHRLGVAAGTCLMMLDRVIFAFDGRPVEWRRAYCHLAGGHYLVEIG